MPSAPVLAGLRYATGGTGRGLDVAALPDPARAATQLVQSDTVPGVLVAWSLLLPVPAGWRVVQPLDGVLIDNQLAAGLGVGRLPMPLDSPGRFAAPPVPTVFPATRAARSFREPRIDRKGSLFNQERTDAFYMARTAGNYARFLNRQLKGETRRAGDLERFLRPETARLSRQARALARELALDVKSTERERVRDARREARRLYRLPRAPRPPRPPRGTRPPRPPRGKRPPRAPRVPGTKGAKPPPRCYGAVAYGMCLAPAQCAIPPELLGPGISHSSCNWGAMDYNCQCLKEGCTGPLAGFLKSIIKLLPKGWFPAPPPPAKPGWRPLRLPSQGWRRPLPPLPWNPDGTLKTGLDPGPTGTVTRCAGGTVLCCGLTGVRCGPPGPACGHCSAEMVAVYAPHFSW